MNQALASSNLLRVTTPWWYQTRVSHSSTGTIWRMYCPKAMPAARLVPPRCRDAKQVRAGAGVVHLLELGALALRLQLLAAGHERDAQPGLQHAGEALGDGRGGGAVASLRRDEVLRRPRRAVRVQEPGAG